MNADSSARRARRPVNRSQDLSPDASTIDDGPAPASRGGLATPAASDLAERLKQSEARLRRVLQATGTIVYDVDAASGLVDTTGDLEQIAGSEPDTMSREAGWWQDLAHPEDFARVSADFAAAIARGDDQFTAEYRVRHRNGEDRYIRDHVTIVRDDSGQFAGTIGTAVDITGRKHREEQAAQLQELTAALSAALDPEGVGAAIITRAMPALGANAGNVFLLDANGRELVNVALLGYEPEIQEWSRRLPLDGPTMVAEVIRTGESILLPTWKERLKRFPHHRTVHARGGDRAVAGLPLKVEGRTIGALSLAFPTDRAFSEDDRLFMATVADLCAQALERARLYETVQNTASQLRLITERAPAAIAHCDTEGRFLFVNDGYAERFGLTPDQLLGKTILELVGETIYATFREHVDATLAGHEVEFEVTIPYPVMGQRRMQVAYAPDRDERGEVRGFIAVLFDITERQKTEFARQFLADASAILAESLDAETALAAVTRISSLGFADRCVTWLMEDGAPRRIAAAHAGQARAERARAPSLDTPVGFEIPPGLARVLRTGEPEFLPIIPAALLGTPELGDEHRRLAGDPRPVCSISVPLRTGEQIAGAMQFVMTDPARRFTAEDLWLAEELARRCATALEQSRLYRSLQESEARFRQLADAMPQIAWIINADGMRLDYLNQRWFEYTGLDASLGAAAEANEPIHADDLPLVMEHWAEALRTGSPLQSELRLRDREGAYHWFLSRAVPVHDAAGKIVKWFGTSTDIDDTKRAEDEWRAFVDATAHDLRNPLAAVLGQTQLLQRRLRRDRGIRPDDGETRLAAIAAAANRAAGQIDDLMDTVRLRAGQPLEFRPAEVDLAAMAAACVEDARRVGPSHDVRVERDAAELVIHADGRRIERVVRNMLDNAIKYSPDGGAVIVRMRRAEDRAGQSAVLTIEDQGLGIPAADLPHVFNRFHRGGNVAGRIAGSGIGLTGARQIVAQHGGSIVAESAEGIGSTFTLRLPLVSDGDGETARRQG